jgi:hypothetical protein
MTRPNDESGLNAARWWNEKGKEEFERLEFLQKELMASIKKPLNGPEKEEDDEDMGPPDLPEDDEDMGPPDIDEEDEDALEPSDREMDMQSRMDTRRQQAVRRPRLRNQASSRMKYGENRDTMGKSLRAELELKRAFSPEKRRDLAKGGMALPDGSFPIVTEEDLKNAIMAYGRAKSKAAAKRHIMKRARALKRADLIPDAWGKKDAKSMPGGSYADTDMPMSMPKKKKKLRYGEKEHEAAEMEDDEMTSPMSREELMNRIFKKKKKKPAMPEKGEDDDA